MNTSIWHRLLFLVGLFFLLYSCSREGASFGIRNSLSSTTNSELAYLQIQLSRPNEAVLRSLSIEDPMSRIETISLLFYDTSTNTLESVKELSISSPQQLQNIIVRLIPKDYKLVAVANATAQIKRFITAGSPISNLRDPQPLNTSVLYDAQRHLIPMSNAQGEISVSRDMFQGERTSEPSKLVSLKLEPMLARVLVYGEPEIRMGHRGSSTAKYQINNILKKTTLLRLFNKLSTGSEEVAGDKSPREQRYAKSYPWDTWVQNPSFDEIGAHPIDGSWADNMNAVIRSGEGDFNESELRNIHLYAKETAIPKQAFLKGLTPYVLIAFPYIPDGLALSEGEGWLSYRGRLFREQEVKRLLVSDVDEHQDLKEAMRNNKISEASFDKGFDVDGIKFYYKGYNYYSVFIKHFGDASAEGYGKYGIVRGNEYHIRLREIAGAGSPIPLNYQNNAEEIVEQEHNSLNISVEARIRRSQDADL